MENNTQTQNHVPEQSEAAYRRAKTRLISRVLVISTVIVYLLETLVMFLMESYISVPHPFDQLLDGLFLILLLLPINYLFIVRPLAHEIDRHHQTGLELFRSHEILNRFFSIKDVMIAYMDARFNFIRVNHAYAGADQRDPSFYPGKNHFDLFPNQENRVIFEKVVKTGEAYNITEKPFEYAANPERGITYWDWSLLPVKNLHGEVDGVLLSLTDVTGRKRTQLALTESERRFRAAFNQTFQHIALLDPSGNITLANQTALDFTGLSMAGTTGKPLWAAPWWAGGPGEGEKVRAAVRQAAAGEVARLEQRVRSDAGETAIMDLTIKPIFDDADRITQLIYEARDNTSRIQAEEALKHSQEETRRLYDAEKRARTLAETLRRAGMDLSRSLESTRVLETLLDRLGEVVAYTSAHFLRFDDEDHLVIHVARGEEGWPKNKQLLGRRIEIADVPDLSSLLKDHQPGRASDMALQLCPLFFKAQDDIRSCLAIPVTAGEQVIGICMLEHEQPDFFTGELIQWATALVNQASVAIQNAWLFEQVRDNRERLQSLSRRLVEVQEMERHYIAQELHDEAGQALALLMVGLRLIEREGGDPAAVAARSQELKKIADGVLDDLHRLAMDLRPATLDHLGLVPALRQQAKVINDRHGVLVQFETMGQIDRLPGDMETAVYRIVQEALTNVIKHAHASRVDILLEHRGDSLILLVEDNGSGFDPRIAKVGHLGLLGMRERAEMLGGSITIESVPATGTTILLELPWPSGY